MRLNGNRGVAGDERVGAVRAEGQHPGLPESTTTIADEQRAARVAGHDRGEAASWDSLGYTHHRLGETNEALDCYRQALKLHRTVGHRYDEAYVLIHIGEAHAATGEDHLAAETWRAALAILTELDHPDAEPLRARLQAAGDRSTAPNR